MGTFLNFFEMASEKTVDFTTPNGRKVGLRVQAFLNNEYVDAKSGATIETKNPATEEVIASFAACDKEDVDLAVKYGRAALAGPWGKMSGAERGRLINRLADLIEENREDIGSIEVTDNGKPYAQYMAADMVLIVSHLRYYAGWADKVVGETHNYENDQIIMTLKEPVGLVAQVIPWNFPLLMMAWKLGPALAAGCCTIVKPAEDTSLGALYLGDLVRKAGFPPGVVQVLTGYGPKAGQALAEHLDIDKIAFTGSVGVGKKIMEAAAKSNLKKVTLELGGKSPLVVFEDADVDEAVALSHQAIFFNQGQVCTAASRVFVQESVYDKFMEKAKKAAVERVGVTGDPFDSNTQQGAQVSETQYKRIMEYIEHGKKEATLEVGGVRKGDKGFFIEPTIFSNVESGHKIHDEEIFGPVMSVIKFTDMDDAIKKSNDTTFGLAAAIVTPDIKKTFRLVREIKAGTIWCNTYHAYHDAAPFGGYKQSGIGREKGQEALENYLETKTVFIDLK